MDINFCDNCENILYIYSDEESNLYLGCKVCSLKKPYENTKSIYNNEFKIDLSQTINKNKYLNYDNTLPVIEGNKNIKCPNEECPKKEYSSVTYIKYDEKEMKYIYTCRHCGQKWKNN